MDAVESKLPNVGTSIFTVMSCLAEQHDAINLSQGFPDFQPPEALIGLVEKYLREGKNQYAPMAGILELRLAIAGLVREKYAVHVDARSEITVTPGATEALFAAIHAVVRPGDEVIVFDPAYDSYEPAVTLAGGRTIHLPLTDREFLIDWDAFHDSLSDRTRLVIINSPHNPTGSLIERSDLDRMAELLRPYACYILSDEVYEHIVFDGREHATVLAQPELAQRSFAVFSFGKTYHATGWKVGYCVAPPALTNEFRAVHQFLMFATTTPLQYAFADYIRGHPEHYRELADFYQTKRDYFSGLMQSSRFELLPSRGTYFQLADYSQISDMPDVEFAKYLTTECKVAVIPVSVFCKEVRTKERLIRFCFAKQNSTLQAAAERIGAL